MSSESSSSSASDSEDEASRPRREFPPGNVTVIFTLPDGAEARRTKVDLPDGVMSVREVMLQALEQAVYGVTDDPLPYAVTSYVPSDNPTLESLQCVDYVTSKNKKLYLFVMEEFDKEDRTFAEHLFLTWPLDLTRAMMLAVPRTITSAVTMCPLGPQDNIVTFPLRLLREQGLSFFFRDVLMDHLAGLLYGLLASGLFASGAAASLSWNWEVFASWTARCINNLCYLFFPSLAEQKLNQFAVVPTAATIWKRVSHPWFFPLNMFDCLVGVLTETANLSEVLNYSITAPMRLVTWRLASQLYQPTAADMLRATLPVLSLRTLGTFIAFDVAHLWLFTSFGVQLRIFSSRHLNRLIVRRGRPEVQRTLLLLSVASVGAGLGVVALGRVLFA